MSFLLNLVGPPGKGPKQIFLGSSESTLLVNEYIRHNGDFDGFFAKSE
ncbi:MAG: hypothetical protein ACYTBJ_21105 [Planctomycetota bacterium]